MESGTDERTSELSKTELRKLKLAEYLAAKGRLKAPNPKPYLKDRPVTKKYTENIPKENTAGENKENGDVNLTNVKEVKTLKCLPGAHKKTARSSPSKKQLGTNSQVRGTLCSGISCNASLFLRKTKSTVSQADVQVLRGQNNRPPSLHNPKLQKTGKTSSSQPNGTHQKSLQNVESRAQQTQPSSQAVKTTQKSTKSSLGPSQPERGVSAHRRAEQSSSKADPQSKRPLAKFTSVSTVTESSVKTTLAVEKRLKSRRSANDTETKIQTNNFCKAQTRSANLTQQHRVQSVVPKLRVDSKTVSRTSQSATDKSNQQRRKDLSCLITKVDIAKSKSQNRVATTGVSSTVSKPTKSGTSAIVKNKQLNAVKPADVPASKQPCVRSTRSLSLPRTNAASQELQQATKKSIQAKPTMLLKTPKASVCPSTQGVRTAPVDGQKKATAAQEERLRKLQEWRETRGISYKRPPMPVRLVRRKTVSAFPQPYWTDMEQEDEVHGIVFAVDRSLDDCINLIQQGFPVEQVRDVLSRVPMAHKFAKYWICQARLMEREENFEILPMFQEAVRVVREPVDELRSVVFEILKKNQAQEMSSVPKESEAILTEAEHELEVPDDITCTPKPVGALICGMRGDSSVVKYKITATPGGKKSHQMAEPGQVNGHEIRFFTPVRRSVRIERTAQRYPTVLLEHDPCVTSLSDLAAERKGQVKGDAQPQNPPVYVYRENDALKDRVQVQLVYPDEAET